MLYILILLSCGSDCSDQEQVKFNITQRRAGLADFIENDKRNFFYTNSNIVSSFAFHLADLKKNLTEEVDNTFEAGADLTQAIYLLYLLQYFINQKNYSPRSKFTQLHRQLEVFYANLSSSPLCRTRVLNKHVLKASYPLCN